ncbi:hypothetical protein KC887_08915 [Candidatus Kaiserbacteria bacterium]|nr:hypothetical protein [Candidatus Kaiserbacteria bacterium]
MHAVSLHTFGFSKMTILIVVALVAGALWIGLASHKDQKITVPETVESTSNQAPYLKTQAELEAEAATKEVN